MQGEVLQANGGKLRKIVKVGATVQYEQDYLGGLEYRKVGTNAKRLEAVYHDEGRWYNLNVEVNNTLSIRYEYSLRDHLGNTRLTFTDRNANGIVDITNNPTTNDILQENHYYAFGMAYEGPWLMNDAARDTKYQYNGKEMNDDFGLNWMDYGARWYDAAIGRWNAPDPSAEQYYSLSPFIYGGNNPILFIDPDGRKIEYGNVTKEEKRDFKEKVKSLSQQSETFKALWKDLKKSSHVHTVNAIRRGENNSHVGIKDPDGYKNGTNRGTDININLNQTSLEEKEVPNKIVIGHEIGHAWRNDQGKVDRNLPEPPSATDVLRPGAALEYNDKLTKLAYDNHNREEIEASHIENIIRAEVDPSGTSIPLRAQYSNLTRMTQSYEFKNGKLETIVRPTPYNPSTIRSGYDYYNRGNNHYQALKKGN